MPKQLANELVDVIHYTFAIASLNKIDLNTAILEKDKKASIKYNHQRRQHKLNCLPPATYRSLLEAA